MQGRGSAARVRQGADGEDIVFRAAFEKAGHAMALIVPDGSILEANDAFARIIGYSALALRGIAVQSLVHPDDLNAAMVQVQRLLDGKAQAVETEMRYLHERGHVLWMQLNATLVRGAASRPLYLLWQLEDL